MNHGSKLGLTAGVRIRQAQLFFTLLLVVLFLLFFKSGPVLLNHLNVDLNSGEVNGEDVAEDEASTDEEGEPNSTLVTQVQEANQSVLKPRS